MQRRRAPRLAPDPILAPSRRRRRRPRGGNLFVDALLGPQARAADPEAAALVGGAFRRATRRGMSGAIGSVSLHRPDLTPVFAKISAPMMICVAVGDSYWTPADAARAAGCLPNGGVRHPPRVRSDRPAVRSGARRGGPAHRFLGQPRCGGHPSARRGDSLGTSPAGNLTASASWGEFRSPGQISTARQPPRRRCASARMARAAHPSARRLRPAMALPNVFALTGGVS
jgi:hypothetical protein